MSYVLLAVLLIPACLGNHRETSENESRFVYSFAPTALATGINSRCIKDSQYYVAALSNGSKWARKMYESSGKLPEYIPDTTDVTHHQAGWFDDCLSILSDDGGIQGQYCSVFFDDDPRRNGANVSIATNIKRPFTVMDIVPLKSHRMVGLCIPASCSDLDLRTAVAQGISAGGNSKSYVILTDEKYCYTQKEILRQSELDSAAISVIILLSLLCLLVVVATFHESRCCSRESCKGSSIMRVLHCFSAITNTKKLLSTSSGSADDITCLYGLRVLYTVWIVITHTAQSLFFNSIYNRNSLAKESSNWSSQILSNGFVSVDVFFLMSGMLTAISLLSDLDRRYGRLKLFSHYFHRYVRLTPVVAVILAFMTTLYVRLGSGPEWATVQYMAEDCKNRWWTHLFYLNNYVFWGNNIFEGSSMQCMPETWYLACDMQMFWISPLIIYPLWRRRRVGLAWAILVIAASIGANFAVYFAWDLPPSLIVTRPSTMSKASFYMTSYYMQTYLRLPPYILGILLGYVIHKNKGSQYPLKMPFVIVGWILSTLISAFVLFGLIPFASEEEVPVIDPYFSAFYGSLHRLAWTAAVGWVIFACVNGNGGFINEILSWKWFIPLSRLTLVVYLTHLNYIRAIRNLGRQPIDFSMAKEIVFGLGVITLSFISAIVISVIVEIPFLNLERLFNPSRRPTQKACPAAVRSSEDNAE